MKESVFMTMYGVQDILDDFIHSNEKSRWYYEPWGGCIVAHWFVYDSFEDGADIIDYDRYIYTSEQVFDAAKAIGIDNKDIIALTKWLNEHQDESARYDKIAICDEQILLGF